ncbi:hypothetical protein ACFOGJ_08960 [Marinibaculum pumilum]|uniref:Uncharacterized protein n=1 Tax=Marinibaculum pumilum TaxID=1766165 RepID=A0ABV7KZE6_9PROT
MMRLLALDQNNVTGGAVGDAGGSPLFWSWRLPAGKDGDNGPRFAALYDHVCGAIREHQPDRVIYETPFLKLRQRAQTTRLVMGYAAIVEAACVACATPCCEATVQEWRRFLLSVVPKGSEAAKAATMAYCRRLGWQVRNDHEGDACGLWFYGCSLFVPSLAARTGPLFQGAA